MYRRLGDGREAATCDEHVPADWTGEARPSIETLPDLGGRKAFSKREAADTLGVSVDHFERRIMPELRVIQRGSRVLIPADELDAWLAQSKARALKKR